MERERRHLLSKEAARRLGITTNTLRAWRRDGKGPRYYRVARTVVVYRESDIEAYMAEREQRAQETGDGVHQG